MSSVFSKPHPVSTQTHTEPEKRLISVSNRHQFSNEWLRNG